MSNKTVRLEIRKNVEVDVLIANAIKTLNEKGYTTLYSCSGHCENLSKVRENTHSMGAYVFFTPNEFLLFKNIPKKWQYQDSTFQSNILSAKRKLKNLIEQLRQIVDKYNSCVADHNYASKQEDRSNAYGNSAFWDMVYISTNNWTIIK